MKKVKSNKTFSAYKIEDENGLDSFLTEEVEDFDSIHRNGTFVKVSFCGNKLFSFDFGDWLVIEGSRTKTYKDDEFLENFSFVE